MAQFRGTIIGRRGAESTKLGDRVSGLTTKCDGWQAGVQVEAHVTREGTDAFNIFITGGSSGSKKELIGVLLDGKFTRE